jgi:hypothetical protein
MKFIDELRTIKPEWHVWLGLLYVGATLIGIGTGEYCAAYGSTMILHALLITYCLRHPHPVSWGPPRQGDDSG